MLKRLDRFIFHNQYLKKSIKRQCSASQSPKTETEGSYESAGDGFTLLQLRTKYPEFLPNPTLRLRNRIREELEREDMMRRRRVLNIPEFYVGTIMAVTTSNVHAVEKVIRFLGICIYRRNMGLGTSFILRNVIHGEGVEILYQLYCPLIQKIEIIRLEKRLDDELYYLRDAPLEYSTFPFDMPAEYIDERAEIKINTIKVPLNPRPWYQRWERMNLQGAILPPLNEKIMKKAEKAKKPWEKYDLMADYRKDIPKEEIKEIFEDKKDELKKMKSNLKQEKEKTKFENIHQQRLNLDFIPDFKLCFSGKYNTRERVEEAFRSTNSNFERGPPLTYPRPSTTSRGRASLESRVFRSSFGFTWKGNNSFLFPSSNLQQLKLRNNLIITEYQENIS